MLKKFIIGDGFEDEALNKIIVNSDILGEITLYRLLSQVAQTVSRQKAAALSIQYDVDLKISAVSHVPYRDVRFGKQDSNEYSGLIHYYNNWHKDPAIGYKESDIQKVNIFNPLRSVIAEQWAARGRNYRGQIAILRLDDEYIYPLAPIDPALEDADTEGQIKLFKNSELNKGFFAKYILWHTAFADVQEQVEFKQVLNKFEGGDHDSSILMAEAQFDPATGNMISDGGSFKLEKLEQNINDNIFDSYEKSIANNIRKAFYSIPSILIEQQDDAFFGQSGTAFTEAFKFYNTQTKDIRSALSQWIASIMKYSSNPNLANGNYTIKNLSYGTMDTGRAAND